MAEQKIIDYIVIGDEKESELTKQVRWRIDEGWQPLGGIAIDCQGGDLLLQAMVK